MSKSTVKYIPELEQDYQRSSTVGYEPEGSYGFLRCLEHGAPSSLIRWHHHEEYELHLITKTSGKFFVGDYIGEFKPGNLVLTGPNLPHNWISTNIPEEGVVSSDFCLQFADEPYRKAAELLPELKQALPLLDRAKNGIEFIGISNFTHEQLKKIKASVGIESINEFLKLILELSKHKEYKLLSTVQVRNYNDDDSMNRFHKIIDYIIENYNTNLSMANIAEKIGMDSSQFSRCFKKASGNTFTEFINRLRINRACQLLTETEKYISTICYEVGYNNVANFNRRFIEIKKMTPSKYRKRSQVKFT